jgi:hypothetical protein
VKKSLLLRSCAAGFGFFVAACIVSAHEHDVYRIGSAYYVVTVGSLNEPFVVDDRSGVDFRVARLSAPPAKGAKSGLKGTPVSGLEQTLKVELAAGSKKEMLSLEPSDSASGSYSARFVPTVQTTYTYRVFGTIDSLPVDLSFSCTPGEVSETSQDNSTVKVSDTVTRIGKTGGFGCPASRGPLGFPEPANSSYELNQDTQNLASDVQRLRTEAQRARTFGTLGLVSGIAGLVFAILALKQK